MADVGRCSSRVRHDSAQQPGYRAEFNRSPDVVNTPKSCILIFLFSVTHAAPRQIMGETGQLAHPGRLFVSATCITRLNSAPRGELYQQILAQ